MKVIVSAVIPRRAFGSAAVDGAFARMKVIVSAVIPRRAFGSAAAGSHAPSGRATAATAAAGAVGGRLTFEQFGFTGRRAPTRRSFIGFRIRCLFLFFLFRFGSLIDDQTRQRASPLAPLAAD